MLRILYKRQTTSTLLSVSLRKLFLIRGKTVTSKTDLHSILSVYYGEIRTEAI